ncbi:hypothetical protein OBBRIDRAFT_80328 [Obba rivulosa]|uniref:Uncharacterized protein n=1 Tax=Obba rivulosa TaxID=1052685 RepID=A0A8E2AQJ8_9APHY|nr:hypothetical protein OBBRIDRAFT_80328 [Obba rivulosa]
MQACATISCVRLLFFTLSFFPSTHVYLLVSSEPLCQLALCYSKTLESIDSWWLIGASMVLVVLSSVFHG